MRGGRLSDRERLDARSLHRHVTGGAAQSLGSKGYHLAQEIGVEDLLHEERRFITSSVGTFLQVLG